MMSIRVGIRGQSLHVVTHFHVWSVGLITSSNCFHIISTWRSYLRESLLGQHDYYLLLIYVGNSCHNIPTMLPQCAAISVIFYDAISSLSRITSKEGPQENVENIAKWVTPCHGDSNDVNVTRCCTNERVHCKYSNKQNKNRKFGFLDFYRATACNAPHGIANAFLRVCLCLSPVCQTRGMWQNERNLCPHSYTTWMIIYLVFWQEEWLVGRPLLPENLGQTDPVGTKTPICNQYSLVAPQPYHLAKKVQLTLTGSPIPPHAFQWA